MALIGLNLLLLSLAFSIFFTADIENYAWAFWLGVAFYFGGISCLILDAALTFIKNKKEIKEIKKEQEKLKRAE